MATGIRWSKEHEDQAHVRLADLPDTGPERNDDGRTVILCDRPGLSVNVSCSVETTWLTTMHARSTALQPGKHSSRWVVRLSLGGSAIR